MKDKARILLQPHKASSLHCCLEERIQESEYQSSSLPLQTGWVSRKSFGKFRESIEVYYLIPAMKGTYCSTIAFMGLKMVEICFVSLLCP